MRQTARSYAQLRPCVLVIVLDCTSGLHFGELYMNSCDGHKIYYFSNSSSLLSWLVVFFSRCRFPFLAHHFHFIIAKCTHNFASLSVWKKNKQTTAYAYAHSSSVQFVLLFSAAFSIVIYYTISSVSIQPFSSLNFSNSSHNLLIYSELNTFLIGNKIMHNCIAMRRTLHNHQH